MFKQTYGFDVDILKKDTPITIEDSEPRYRDGRKFISYDREEDLNYFCDNKSGTYLIKESTPTMLWATNVNGEIIKLPIKHFLGENPRMKIKLFV